MPSGVVEVLALAADAEEDDNVRALPSGVALGRDVTDEDDACEGEGDGLTPPEEAAAVTLPLAAVADEVVVPPATLTVPLLLTKGNVLVDARLATSEADGPCSSNAFKFLKKMTLSWALMDSVRTLLMLSFLNAGDIEKISS